MDRISRRRFLQDTAAVLAAAAVPASQSLASAGAFRRVSANEKIHVVVIGAHGRGNDHISEYLSMPDVVLHGVCDPDTAVQDKVKARADKAGLSEFKTYTDIRKLLEDKQVDAVSIATPNHWHSLAAIWAMQAGKDAYVEKPVCHNVWEGRKLVEAARKYNRICAAGTQSRSSRGLIEAMDYLHSGKLGKIRLARGLCYKPRKSIGKVTEATPVPATVDYDLWLGPAPKVPVMRKSFHYDWHWFWDYGNGDLGNQGVHEMDKARWGLGKTEMPKSVISLGGRFGYVDDGQTPNTELAFLDYGDVQIIFEVRGLETPAVNGVKVGNVFYGEKGVMAIPSYSDATVFDNDGNKVTEFHGGGSHFRNFIEAVKSRKASDLKCEIEEGHRSSALCCLANIPYRMGTEVPFNPKTKAFGDDKDAYEAYGRFEEHLTANGITLSDAKYKLGPKLTIDPRKEAFVGNAAANALLKDPYRAPFVVPDKV